MSTATAGLKVGTELPPLPLPSISRTTLALFAGASGDHNPIHIDIDAAKEAGMDDVFAHGMLSMAYLGRLLTGWLPQARLRSFSTRFTAITPALAEPTCSGRVTALDGDTATLEIQIKLADGTETLRGQAVVGLV